ncbi:MAG: dipeptidase [Planctomycetota bacterium]|jgi:membrane dipeptidase
MTSFTDAHLDIAWSSIKNGRDFVSGHPDAAAGLPDLLAGGVTLACATIFCCDDDEESTAAEMAEQQLAYYDALPGRSNHRVIWPADVMDVGMCTAGEKICLIGLLEGCEPVSAPEEMAEYYRRGVRVAALTWNRNNRWAGGCNGNNGLTMDGVALVKEMDRLGMVHDVSHLSRMSVDDLLGTARGPIIASHVGADAIRPHVRNLTDDHLRAIAQRGGVVGLVLYAKFLGEGRPSLRDAMKHLRHMIEICGVDSVGIGSDMDGGFGKDELPVGFRTAADLPQFADALREHGYSESDVDKVCGGNFRRVLTSVM